MNAPAIQPEKICFTPVVVVAEGLLMHKTKSSTKHELVRHEEICNSVHVTVKY